MNDSTSNITKTVFFNAPPEIVWQYLTEKDKLAQWFHPAEADLREGEDYALVRKADDGASIRQIWGRVLRMNKPNKLVYTFIVEPFAGNETTVSWFLQEAAGGTRLTLLHEGVAEATGEAAMQLLQALDKGWDEHLADLRVSVASAR